VADSSKQRVDFVVVHAARALSANRGVEVTPQVRNRAAALRRWGAGADHANVHPGAAALVAARIEIRKNWPIHLRLFQDLEQAVASLLPSDQTADLA